MKIKKEVTVLLSMTTGQHSWTKKSLYQCYIWAIVFSFVFYILWCRLCAASLTCFDLILSYCVMPRNIVPTIFYQIVSRNLLVVSARQRTNTVRPTNVVVRVAAWLQCFCYNQRVYCCRSIGSRLTILNHDKLYSRQAGRTFMYTYIYIYICVCVCVCVSSSSFHI